MREPQRGEVWRHAKGGEYVIVGRATLKAPTPEGDSPENGMVLYRPFEYEMFFVRSLEHFLERFIYVRGPTFLTLVEGPK